MAGRRMVNIRIIDSDNFLELPLSTHALYSFRIVNETIIIRT